MRLLTVGFLFSCFTFALCSNISISQVFPMNESYCCHCPSLGLKCSFQPDAVFVWWSIPTENITNIQGRGVEGHMIDNSSVTSGCSTMMVSNASFLRKDYICIPIYANGSKVKSTPQPVPPVENTTKSFTSLDLEDKNKTSLHITWIHPYPECKQFTVYLDGKQLVNVSKNTSYTITGLTPATKYNVTVVAMEDPLPIQVISNSFLTDRDEPNLAGRRSTTPAVVAIAIFIFMLAVI